ncbi:hypothetical protein EST38_g14020 [Candolleomyces aberdarensis]|uniref:Uncharacterized protein n=1 Tax=Candolleomyces aberdarensis TaxID=2316362 RepID=A0A4Q2D137_9AGAR|nr:hypothetical protein EST38_g14020 [Candolleomyces aberdarensis]
MRDVKEEDDSDSDIEIIEDTDDEEIRKLKAQLAALEEKKAAKGVSNGRPSKRTKRETTSALVPGEVIDLTM